MAYESQSQHVKEKLLRDQERNAHVGLIHPVLQVLPTR